MCSDSLLDKFADSFDRYRCNRRTMLHTLQNVLDDVFLVEVSTINTNLSVFYDFYFGVVFVVVLLLLIEVHVHYSTSFATGTVNAFKPAFGEKPTSASYAGWRYLGLFV